MTGIPSEKAAATLARSPVHSASTSEARGFCGVRSGRTMRIRLGVFDVFTYRRVVSGSKAPPPQLAPPEIPGRMIVPSRLGGV